MERLEETYKGIRKKREHKGFNQLKKICLNTIQAIAGINAENIATYYQQWSEPIHLSEGMVRIWRY